LADKLAEKKTHKAENRSRSVLLQSSSKEKKVFDNLHKDSFVWGDSALTTAIHTSQ